MTPQALFTIAIVAALPALLAAQPIVIGGRPELFVDDHLIDRMGGGAALRLHSPRPREIVMAFDRAWEGNTCGVWSVWGNRCNYIWYGLIETASDLPGNPTEYSIFSCEHYYMEGAVKLRRFTYRPDGFVSVNAPFRGGEVVTKPLVFSGEHLTLNFSTSAAGSLRVEIQDQAGKPIPGFALADCDEVFGDEIERVVSWKKVRDLSGLATRTVRLRFQMRDADLFSLRVGSGDLLTIRNGS